ncbi:hypothetical protein DTL21_04095 [Bremerella cremea]|uniref:HEAT repeat domain-containing protein n=1 Tax=Blastopirellula marina TaxID=124 RepID=A0A2S8FY81_9BACT|nr:MULTISPECIES: hypothetical protein [Pirellulaceae]PQO37145.1 hypothetical protein C5Y83_04095 [Blastopirellula marina]RCS49532.1 hypothetical protein DTL21_04095 [Bremerella cremea]
MKQELEELLLNMLKALPIKDDDVGTKANLLKSICYGNSIEKLRPLLSDPDRNVRTAGALILSRSGQSCSFVKEAMTLMRDASPWTRLYASDVMFRCASQDRPEYFGYLACMLEDQDLFIRSRAIGYTCLANVNMIRMALDFDQFPESTKGTHKTCLKHLIVLDRLEVIKMLNSKDALEVRYGVAGAAKMRKIAPELERLARTLTQKEVVNFFYVDDGGLR